MDNSKFFENSSHKAIKEPSGQINNKMFLNVIYPLDRGAFIWGEKKQRFFRKRTNLSRYMMHLSNHRLD